MEIQGDNFSYYWKTEYYHDNNSFTMEDFLSNHLPEEAIINHIDGSYAEVEYNGIDYGIHAYGNGDSFNHVVRFEVI